MPRRRQSKSSRNLNLTMDEEPSNRRPSSGVQVLIAAATAKLHINEAAAHLKAEHYSEALQSYNEALGLKSKDKEALVARSKCYILLGKPKSALKDAETALSLHRNYIPALYQKAESLYHLGHFEHSLMYYHRGLRKRPQLDKFRLGVQKAQEAIINTIGPTVKLGSNYIDSGNSSSRSNRQDIDKTPENKTEFTLSPVQTSAQISPTPQQNLKSTSHTPDVKRPTSVLSTKSNGSKPLLGALTTDKLYLEKLIKHPHLKCLSKQNKRVVLNAEEALEYLNTREKFWEQQFSPPTIQKKNISAAG